MSLCYHGPSGDSVRTSPAEASPGKPAPPRDALPAKNLTAAAAPAPPGP